MVEIKKCSFGDCNSASKIINDCKIHLENQGVFQWTENYPSIQIIQNDVSAGSLYKIILNKSIAGLVTINSPQENKYKSISWLFEEKSSLVIDRLAIAPVWQGQGLAKRLMGYAQELGLKGGFKSIRLDVYSGNDRVIEFYEKIRYLKRCEIFSPGRALPFYCYEKRISHSVLSGNSQLMY